MLHSLSHHLRFYHINDIRRRKTTQIVKVSYETFSVLSVSCSHIFLSNFLLAFVKVKLNDPLRSPLVTISTNSFNVQKFYVLPIECTYVIFTHFVCPSVCNLVLATKLFARVSWNLVVDFFTQCCEASVSFVKIGWVILYLWVQIIFSTDIGEIRYRLSPRNTAEQCEFR
jgi:hypothetical protein